MSESFDDILVRQSLELQQTVLRDLQEAGRDRVKAPTLAGLGRAAIYEWGGAVMVDARLWAEDELQNNGTLFVEVDSVLYRVEIRDNTVEVYNTHTDDQVTNTETLEKIIFDISFMHEVYLFNSGKFEDATDKVIQ